MEERIRKKRESNEIRERGKEAERETHRDRRREGGRDYD